MTKSGFKTEVLRADIQAIWFGFGPSLEVERGANTQFHKKIVEFGIGD